MERSFTYIKPHASLPVAIILAVTLEAMRRKDRPDVAVEPQPFGSRRRFAQTQQDFARFDELTDLVLARRTSGRGLWKHFKSDAPDEVLRSNIKVFLAGALEATTSYATWAISHLARHPAAQQRVYEEVERIEEYTPERLDAATYFGHVLDETLRLSPSLYFLPRRATSDTWIDRRGLMIGRSEKAGAPPALPL